MSRLVLVTGSDPATLLRAAAAPFLVDGRVEEPLPLLALRQGGLRDEVHRLASEAGAVGWVGEPILVFGELPDRIVGDRHPLDEFERRALIHAAIAKVHPSTLPATAQRTLVEALDRLFGDCCAEELEPDALRATLDAAGGDAWERGRDADLAALYAEYRRSIGDRTDGRDGLALAARAIRERPDDVRRRLRRPFDPEATPRALHIYGLADLRRGWRALLEALHASDVVSEVRVHLTDPVPGTADDAEPLRAWMRARGDAVVRVAAGAADPAIVHLRRALLAPSIAREPQSAAVRAVAAPDMTRELDHVARAVKQLIVHRGAKPHEIAVVARKARPYLTRAAGAFAAHGIPVHARLRHTLTEIPAVAAVLRLFRVAANGWRISELEALGASPYFEIPLEREVMRSALGMIQGRGLGAWRAALEDLRRTVEQLGPDSDDLADLPPLADVERAIAGFERFAATVTQLERSRTAADWIALTQAVIGDDRGMIDGAGSGDGSTTAQRTFLGYADRVAPPLDGTAPRELRDAVRLDTAALLHVDELLRAWAASLVHDPGAARRLDAAQWAAELEDILEDAEVTVRTGHTGGVHLLEALSAEGRSFAHVFVLGLESGAFPADAAPDPLFGEDERVRLAAAGVPVEPASVWLAREASLFRNLMLGARESVSLSWCYADANGAPRLESAFAEDVLSRFGTADGRMKPHTIPGSAVVAGRADEVWSGGDALRLFAQALGEGRPAEGDVAAVLGAAVEHPAMRIAAGQLLHAAAIEQLRDGARAIESEDRHDYVHDFNGDVSDEHSLQLLADRFRDRVWSATQLERIGRCGFAFLAGTAMSLRASGDVDPDDADARDVGSARHVALSRIYQRLDVLLGAGEPTDAERAEIAAVVHEEVERAIEEQGGGWTRLEGLRKARVQELANEITEYITWEMKPVRGIAPRRPVATELSFGLEDAGLPAAILDAGDGRTVRLRGQIDRIDAVLVDGEDDGWRYVVDHKSSGGALTDLKQLQPAGAVLQLALYLHVLDQVQPGAKPWGGTYQLVRTRERKAPLERCSAVKKGINVVANDTQKRANEVIEGAATLAANLVDTALAGRLPARTPGTSDCLAYCDFRDVCREERMQPKSW